MATSLLNQSLEAAAPEAGAPLDGHADLYVGNGDAGVQRALADALKVLPGIRAVQPLVIQRVALPELHNQAALLIGADFTGQETGGWRVTINELTPRVFVRAVVFRQRPVLIGRELANALPPESTELNVLVAGQVHRLHCTGVIDATGPDAVVAGNTVVTECEAAAALLGRPDLVSRLDVHLEPGADRTDVQRRLQAELAGRAIVSTPEGHDQRTQEMLSGVKIGMALCGGAALVVGLFLVYNALAVSGLARRHDIGILRSVGAYPLANRKTAPGGSCNPWTCGDFAGDSTRPWPGAIVIGSHAARDVRPLFGLGSKEAARHRRKPRQCRGAGLATTMLAAIVPTARACFETPVDALRRMPARQEVDRRLAVICSFALFALGLGCLLLREHLPRRVGTFGSLALLLVAALVATPLVAAGISRLLEPISQSLLGVAGRLAAGNLSRASGRVAIVIAALAAGTALLLQTAGLVRSNESSVRSWVDQCLAGDLFVTSGGPLTASGQALPMSDRVGRQLEEMHPDIRAVPLRFRYLDWEHGGRTTRVLLTALDAQAYYEANKDRKPPLADLDLYRALCEPGTALVSENFAALYGVHPDEKIVLLGSEGPVELRVLSTVADYSCNRGTVFVDRARYHGQFDAGLVDVFDVYLRRQDNSQDVRDVLQRSPLAAAQRLSVLTHDELRAHILGMVERLYGLAYTQEVVVAVVALLGVVAALLISVLQRRRELAVLRAWERPDGSCSDRSWPKGSSWGQSARRSGS